MNEKIIAGMATTGERNSLKKSIYSICTQVDELIVYCNNGSFPENFEKPDNVVFVYDEALGDIGDLGKFYSLIKKSGILITVDDDIIYPENYVNTLKPRVSREKVYGVHGTIFNFPILDYYTKNRNVYHFESHCTEDIKVDVVGSGTAIFTDELLEDFDLNSHLKYKNMADLLLLELSLKKGIKRYIIERPRGWLKEVKNDNSIFSHSVLDKSTKFNTGYLQTYFINKLIKVPSNLNLGIPINFGGVEHINYFNNFVSKLNISDEHYIVCKMEDYVKMKNWTNPVRLLSDIYFENGYFDVHYKNYDIYSFSNLDVIKKSPLNRLVTKKINIKKRIESVAQMIEICEFCIKNKILYLDIDTENLHSEVSKSLNSNSSKLDATQIFDFVLKNKFQYL